MSVKERVAAIEGAGNAMSAPSVTSGLGSWVMEEGPSNWQSSEAAASGAGPADDATGGTAKAPSATDVSRNKYFSRVIREASADAAETPLDPLDFKASGPSPPMAPTPEHQAGPPKTKPDGLSDAEKRDLEEWDAQTDTFYDRSQQTKNV